jgi:chemosensory pili system protein ChpA (sensor histidine kinase/response regulator)
MSEAIDYNALNWVQQELGEVLKQARSSLELYAENRDDATSLQDCAKNLHQARGPLRMVALKGADQLASEMEEVTADLLQATLADPELALEVLMQAFLQLPDYLSRLHPGKTDSPAVLLPVINSLREVRGVPVLGVCAVFLPNLRGPLPAAVFVAQVQASEKEIQAMARAARTRFQAGLLEWYRGDEGNNGLQTLLAVLRQMQEQTSRKSVARLWWAATAITEAIISGDIPEATENKQMYGQLDRQIKRLVEVGESVFEDPLTDELMKHLLYRIAITESSLESIQLVKAHYNLDELLNRSGNSLADDASLAGCSDELLQTVATTASADIERIKDSLDIFTRGDRSNPDSLLPVADELHALGNMLDMVGLDQIGNDVAEKAQLVRDMATGGSDIEDPALMAVANLLVAVEDAVHNLGDSDSTPENGDADRLFLQEGMQAVAREAVADMVRAKEAIVGYMHTPGNFETLAEVPILLSRVRGSLQLSGQDRAAIAAGQVKQFIAGELLEKHIQMSDSQLELLADAVCSIEYYIEELDEAHEEGDRVLGIAESSLDALGYACPQLMQGQEQEQEVCGQDEMPLQLEQCESGMPADTPADEPADAPEVVVITDLQVIDAGADEEILEIFIEEADEVLAALGEQLAAWSASVDAEQPLMDARRGFHTIKGSGRMVGALALAEFAWTFEDLLNRVIEGAVEPVAELLDLVNQSVAAMTQLLAQVKGSDAAPQADVNAIAHRAMMLSQPGRQDVEPGPEAGPEVEVEAEFEVEVETEADVDVPVVCIEQAAGEQALKQEMEFASCPVLADDADPEILEIYLEEAAAASQPAYTERQWPHGRCHAYRGV